MVGDFQTSATSSYHPNFTPGPWTGDAFLVSSVSMLLWLNHLLAQVQNPANCPLFLFCGSVTTKKMKPRGKAECMTMFTVLL